MIDLGSQAIVMREADELTPNPWNPNSVGIENMEKLTASLDKNGFFKPVLIRTLDDGTLEIIGGQHRIEAAKELGMKVPTINLGNISDLKAKKFTLMDNDSYGENDSNLLAKVISDLTRGGEDVLNEMTYSEEELSKLVNLTTMVDLDLLSELDDLDLDLEPEAPRENLDEDDQVNYKTIKVKVDISDAEFFEDQIHNLCERHGIEDSDLAVMRGTLLNRLLRDAK